MPKSPTIPRLTSCPAFSEEVAQALVFAGRGGTYTDGCPHCVGGYLRPMHLVTTGTAAAPGVIGWYAHRECGHRWTTSWATEPMAVGIHGEPVPSTLGDILRTLVPPRP